MDETWAQCTLDNFFLSATDKTRMEMVRGRKKN
jgi:hypothetical protein